ncbi:hypothetical protein H6P81_021736 [Aristolochia fimbriata]|uniref:Uncharacterized protein n=1 Tax=Aristolochia fimbriata TaxID=158543 RepID=A0AAV7DQ42_ARIFI|nr:hypothetical protein H6P81_021736 [Aristolochia fimbriata]
MPRHLISDAHEWINEIPTVPVYYPAKPQPRERAWQNQRGKKTLVAGVRCRGRHAATLAKRLVGANQSTRRTRPTGRCTAGLGAGQGPGGKGRIPVATAEPSSNSPKGRVREQRGMRSWIRYQSADAPRANRSIPTHLSAVKRRTRNRARRRR